MEQLVHDLTIIFLGASLVLLLMHRFDHPAVPGYILAGILVGGFVTSDLLQLAQIGIAFLVFMFGLTFDPKRVTSTASAAVKTTLLQITAAGMLGYGIAVLLGFSGVEPLYFAVASAFSSTLVGLQLTEEELEVDRVYARLSESMHLFQDLICLGILAVAFSTTTAGAVDAVLYTSLLVGAAFLVRQFVFPVIAEQAEGNEELLTMTALTFLVGAVAVTAVLDVPMVIGAFAAGVAVSKSAYGLELLHTMGSIKDFFSAIFFVVLGILVSIPTSTTLIAATGLVLMTAFVTPTVIYTGLKLQGYDKRSALFAGLSLDQVSELSLILAIQGYMIGAISSQLFDAVILGATLTMMLSSYTDKNKDAIYGLFPERDQQTHHPHEDHIIVLGYDMRYAQLFHLLDDRDADVVVIDHDPEKVQELQRNDIDAVYGDAMDDITWQEANVSDARLIISLVTSRAPARCILDLDTDAHTILWAETPAHAQEFLDRGADDILVRDVITAQKLTDYIHELLDDTERWKETHRRNLLDVRRHVFRD